MPSECTFLFNAYKTNRTFRQVKTAFSVCILAQIRMACCFGRPNFERSLWSTTFIVSNGVWVHNAGTEGSERGEGGVMLNSRSKFIGLFPRRLFISLSWLWVHFINMFTLSFYIGTFYRVCHGFRLMTQDDYFRVNFDSFWSELHFFRQMGQ